MGPLVARIFTCIIYLLCKNRNAHMTILWLFPKLLDITQQIRSFLLYFAVPSEINCSLH